MKGSRFIVFALVAVLALTACQIADAAPSTDWGASAAVADTSPSIASMLVYAIQDEYLARAEYDAIMQKFGTIRPFSNIIQAEENHIAWLAAEYRTRGLTLPEDTAATRVVVPSTLRGAFEAGVQAEIDNIAMYDRFLADPQLAQTANAELRSLFIRLRCLEESPCLRIRPLLA